MSGSVPPENAQRDLVFLLQKETIALHFRGDVYVPHDHACPG
jgi:hypothetical protein